MQDVGRAIDLYIGELARRRKSPKTRDTYERKLQAFADTLAPYTAVSEVTVDDCRRFLDRWRDSEPSTMASAVTTLRVFFRFLIDEGHVPEPGPMHRIKRPSRKRPADLDVVTVSEDDANKLVAACTTYQELLCITTALYTGRRRAALNAARRHDVDLERGTIRFRDKGDKVINQPIPREYAEIVKAADEIGLWPSPSDYLIPSRRPGAVTKKLRKDSVIWDTVKIVALRAGVESHVHALRAAFAVKFDDQHPDRIDTLRQLMGHESIETTLVYLRRKDRAKDMEAVLDLSWGSGSNREGIAAPPNPAFAEVLQLRPIRDSNPCSDGTASGIGDDDNPPPSRRSELDRKLDELEARKRRPGRRVR